MKKNIYIIIIIAICLCFLPLCLVGCTQAETVQHNIQKDADRFETYRKITFVNLYTNDVLYSAEGYFSMQTTYSTEYQGQQEIGLIFKIGRDKYKMDYFSIDDNVAYVIEQKENTTTNPYYWRIDWYIALPDNRVG